MAIDTLNFKFYPFVHKDNFSLHPSTTSFIDDRFDGKDIRIDKYKVPLFDLLSESNLLAEKTKKCLMDVLKNGKISSGKIDSIISRHRSYIIFENGETLAAFVEKHPASTRIKMLRRMFGMGD